MKSEKKIAPQKNRGTPKSKKPARSFPEVAFLVCPRRKNKPKIQPVVCEKRCRDKRVCPVYYAYIQPGLFKGSDFSPKGKKSEGRKPSRKRG